MHLAGLAGREPPLKPEADEARAWAQAELEKAIYSTSPSLWQRFLDWLADLWRNLIDTNDQLGPVLMPVLILAALAVVVGIALLLGGPLRRRRLRRAGASIEVLDDDARSSAAIRRAADAAAAGGDYATAVLERYRAIVRSLDERAVLEDRRGRTAREAALAAGARLAPCAAGLRWAGDLFDSVCYGHAQPSEADDVAMRDLDREVARTRPSRTGALADNELVAPR